MRLSKILTLLVLLLLPASGLWAQNRTVSGKVLDAQGQAVPGVGIILDGTSTGTLTGADGSYSLQVPAREVVLVFSSLGYVTQRIPVEASRGTVDVTLEEDNMTLEETVVVGYGTQKKVNLTGAITAVESKALENRTAHNLTTMLQGSVPGLNISTSSGNPGSTGSLNIRGYTSINGGEPLVLIDGIEGSINRINPQDVASISVIKDASSAAVYGARAAYGVSWSPPRAAPRKTRPRCATAAVTAWKCPPPPPTGKPPVTGRFIPSTSSGMRARAPIT